VKSDGKKFGDTDLAQCIGLSLIILAICIGIGGCIHLIDSDYKPGDTKEQKQ
jgi:hypothetical protein